MLTETDSKLTGLLKGSANIGMSSDEESVASEERENMRKLALHPARHTKAQFVKYSRVGNIPDFVVGTKVKARNGPKEHKLIEVLTRDL